jgi:hypothetical protein
MDRPVPAGERTPRLYVRCPLYNARRLSLFLVRDVLGCRGWLGLRYLSQGKGQWNGDVMRAVARRLRALRTQPGPKGRRYQAWERRYQRLERDFRAWDRRMGQWLMRGSTVRP